MYLRVYLCFTSYHMFRNCDENIKFMLKIDLNKDPHSIIFLMPEFHFSLKIQQIFKLFEIYEKKKFISWKKAIKKFEKKSQLKQLCLY